LSDPKFRERAPVPEDIPGILSLFEAAFDKPISATHYEWKLRSRPSPVANAVVVVDEAGQPVFHSAGIPCRARIAGAERLVMMGCDVMTAESLRRQGFNTTYSSRMYGRWRDAGVALVLGFANEKWGASAAGVGLRPLGQLASLTLPLRPERMLARKTGVKALGELHLLGRLWRGFRMGARNVKGMEVREVNEAGVEFDRLWALVGARIGRTLVRDRDWVAWRYFGSADTPYRVWIATRDGVPVGYAALATGNPRVPTVAEIFAAPGDMDTFAALVRAVAEAACAGGAESLRTLAVPDSWPFAAFLNSGFRAGTSGTLQHIPLDPKLTKADIGEARDWYFTAGDFDAV
jgi:hypothetical protein